MVPKLFNTGSLPVLEQMLYFTSQRHRAIADNIANADNPLYKPKDAPEAEFKEALHRAIENKDGRPVPVFEFEGSTHIQPKPGGGLDVEFVESEGKVDMEKEMAKLLKNAMLHNFAATLVAQQFNMLHMAISERVTG